MGVKIFTRVKGIMSSKKAVQTVDEVRDILQKHKEEIAQKCNPGLG